jgi:3-oxoacyl-[acyl-carrier-protein] synthase II
MSRRVVITGLGTVNPVGNNIKDFWNRVKEGENGIGRLSRIEADPFPSQVAGEVKDFDPTQYVNKKDVRRMDLFTQYALIASLDAMEDAGLRSGDNIDPERIGVIVGNGIGGIETLSSEILKQHEKGPMGIHPLLIPKMIGNIAPGQIAIKLNAQGPNYTVVTACASGTDAIGHAFQIIRDGMADVMIGGGTEAPLTNIAVGGFAALQALSTRFNGNPEKASRPFDKDRDGFVIAEGAGIVILEDMEHALARGARVYAEVVGYGASCDANHLTQPHPEGRGAISALTAALASAELKPGDVDYINAHGTSTPINDPTETQAIKAVFGEAAKKLKVSSTKSMTGHMLGGAGGVEAIVCALAVKEQFFPPTRNLVEPDPRCDLDYVPGKGVPGRIRAAISNSLGFGGHNAVLVFREANGALPKT